MSAAEQLPDGAFALTVFGTPAPAGSKRAFAIRKGGRPTGRIAVSDASKRSKPWKREIQQAAGRAMLGRDLFEEAIRLTLVFYMRRPKGHLGTGRNAGIVKPSAPDFPTVKPDVLKLARAVEDALSGTVYRDDAQIVSELLEKRYGTPERVEIFVVNENPERRDR